MKHHRPVIVHPKITITFLILVSSSIPLFFIANWDYFITHQTSTGSADGTGSALGMLFFVTLLYVAAFGFLAFLWYSLKLRDMKQLQRRPSSYKLVKAAWVLAGLMALSPLIIPAVVSIFSGV